MPVTLAESFLETPTAFGVPLGALLLFMWLMRAINQSRNETRSAKSAKVSQPTNEVKPSASEVKPSASSWRRKSGFRPSSESLPLAGEVDHTSVEFLSSGFKNDGGRAIIRFRVKLHEEGTFLIAAGKHESGMLDRAHYGYTQVAGSVGEVIKGTVSCPGFTDGRWAIGAFRGPGDIQLV
jgi:hypothetical protein